MEKKVDIILIVVSLIVIIPILLFFVPPYRDFMYVSGDKHWLRGEIADQSNDIGGRKIKKVEQGENHLVFQS